MICFISFYSPRSTVQMLCCDAGSVDCKPCVEKQPIPEHKTYSERTAEIGVFIDKELYQQMAVGKKNSIPFYP